MVIPGTGRNVGKQSREEKDANKVYISKQVTILGKWSLISLVKLKEEFRTQTSKLFWPREKEASVFTSHWVFKTLKLREVK